MSAINRVWSLRLATDADADFLLAVYGSTRVEELALTGWSAAEKDAFVRMQFNAQTVGYRAQSPAAEHVVILVDGAPAGRAIIDRSGPALRVVDMALLPEHRGRGIGTALMRDLQAEAGASGRPIQLHVEIFNRALAWYQRLGFLAVGQQGIHVAMVWRP
jgi:ribosomal protein S18 acetylase RimI-like enzyme